MITPILFIASALTIFALSGMLFFMPRTRTDHQKLKDSKLSLEMPCPACQQIVFITPNTLRPLMSSENALVIREMPDLRNISLGEARCDYCQTALTFRKDTKPPTFLRANIGEPQQQKNACTECHDPFVRPTWPENTYTDIESIPDIPQKLGLGCPHCASITCIACLETNTRKRTQDNTYLCPRCFRGPVDIIHYF